MRLVGVEEHGRFAGAIDGEKPSSLSGRGEHGVVGAPRERPDVALVRLAPEPALARRGDAIDLPARGGRGEDVAAGEHEERGDQRLGRAVEDRGLAPGSDADDLAVRSGAQENATAPLGGHGENLGRIAGDQRLGGARERRGQLDASAARQRDALGVAVAQARRGDRRQARLLRGGGRRQDRDPEENGSRRPHGAITSTETRAKPSTAVSVRISSSRIPRSGTYAKFPKLRGRVRTEVTEGGRFGRRAPPR